jgi:hypothetical protein
MSNGVAPSIGSAPTAVVPAITTISTVAGTAETVMTTAMQFEPTIAGLISMFFPPAAIAQPFIVMAMPFVIKALDAISKQNGGDMIGAVLELAQHLTPGQPNSPALATAGFQAAPARSASEQGSG